MGNNEVTGINRGGTLPVSADVIAGALLTLLGLAHLFVLEVGGMVGGALLLVVWPFIAGVVAAVVDPHFGHDNDPRLLGAIAGVFGAVAIVILILITGWLGLWSGFIFDTFGVDLATVTIGTAILFALTWTVFGFVGAFLASKALE